MNKNELEAVMLGYDLGIIDKLNANRDLATMIRSAMHSEKYKADKLFNADKMRQAIYDAYDIDGSVRDNNPYINHINKAKTMTNESVNISKSLDKYSEMGYTID